MAYAACKRLYDIFPKALADFNRSKFVENQEFLKWTKSKYKIFEQRQQDFFFHKVNRVKMWREKLLYGLELNF